MILLWLRTNINIKFVYKNVGKINIYNKNKKKMSDCHIKDKTSTTIYAPDCVCHPSNDLYLRCVTLYRRHHRILDQPAF